jgi:hypothetical protein
MGWDMELYHGVFFCFFGSIDFEFIKSLATTYCIDFDARHLKPFFTTFCLIFHSRKNHPICTPIPFLAAAAAPCFGSNTFDDEAMTSRALKTALRLSIVSR